MLALRVVAVLVGPRYLLYSLLGACLYVFPWYTSIQAERNCRNIMPAIILVHARNPFSAAPSFWGQQTSNKSQIILGVGKNVKI